MGLFRRLFKKTEQEQGPAERDVPEPVGALAEAGTLYAPVSGRVAGMDEVPDSVFSGGVLGKGCAIWPESSVVYAPCSGTVSVVMGHALGLVSDDGVEVLVHVGVDTVDMHGKGFTSYVSAGASVAAGEALLAFDRGAIAAADHPDCVVVAVTNAAELSGVFMIPAKGGQVEAGSPLLAIER